MNLMGLQLIAQIVVIVLIGGLAFAVYMGWREIESAKLLPFFQVRSQRVARGRRFIAAGILLGVVAAAIQVFGIGAVGRLLPTASTPGIDHTADETTADATATIPRPPQQTATASITPTPTERGTPTLPDDISADFSESVTPDDRAVFGPIDVATDVVYPAQPGDEEFEAVEGTLYGLFSYDYLEPGVRWTAVWLWGDDIVCVDSKPWDDASGGWGYTECEQEQWPAGEYFIHMFLGEEWWITAEFTVLGVLNTPTATP